MFCKNCANPLDPAAVVCVKCGCPKGQGAAYCHNCAAPTPPGAVVCTNCGAPLAAPFQGEQKSKMAAGLLGIFLGAYGVHNFYLGYIGKAVGQLILTVFGWLTSWIFGLGFIFISIAAIWGLIEGIMILTGSANKDAKGNPLKD